MMKSRYWNETAKYSEQQLEMLEKLKKLMEESKEEIHDSFSVVN